MLAGRPDAARAEWNVALQQIERKLGEEPNNTSFLYQKAATLACLGQREEGSRILRLCQQLLGQDDKSVNFTNFDLLALLGHRDDVITWLEDALKNPKRENIYLHSIARFWFALDPLRGDPRFEKLLRDTLPKYAKPFDEPAAKAVPAPQPGR
jgi:Flp pilus assembly protein TadD